MFGRLTKLEAPSLLILYREYEEVGVRGEKYSLGGILAGKGRGVVHPRPLDATTDADLVGWNERGVGNIKGKDQLTNRE